MSKKTRPDKRSSARREQRSTDWGEEMEQIRGLATRIQLVDTNTPGDRPIVTAAKDACSRALRLAYVGAESEGKFGLAAFAIGQQAKAFALLAEKLNSISPEAMRELGENTEFTSALNHAGTLAHCLQNPDFRAAEVLKVGRANFIRQVMEAQAKAAQAEPPPDNVSVGEFGATR